MKIIDRLRSLLNENLSTYRDKLNKNVHIVDISYNALKASDPKLEQSDYLKIIEAFKEKFKYTSSLKESVQVAKDPSSINTYSAIVEDPTYGTYLIAKSYNAIQSRISSVLKSLDTGSNLTGIDTSGKTTTVLKNIASSSIPSGKTPLSSKLTGILAKIDLTSIPVVNKLVEDLYNTQADIEYTFTKPGFDLKGFNKILGSFTDV